MTREQEKALAVALDGLREAGVDSAAVVRALYDEATARTLLAGPVLLVGLRVAAWEYGRDMDIDQPGIFYFVDEALRAAGHGGVWAARGETLDQLVGDANERRRAIRDAGIRAAFASLSPPETSAGASATQSPGETK